jgi:ATP-binding cassette, subfamily C (CFTR/MRP), member 1
MSVRPGELVVVVGPVGSGKSTLLAAIVGDCTKLGGGVRTAGKVAFVGQQPWVQNLSIRQNVAFSTVSSTNTKRTQDREANGDAAAGAIVDTDANDEDGVDEFRLQAALTCAQMGPDIAMLPDGARTELGEDGVNISGGQRQRLALARAVYADADIYLLDDVLSALDAKVGITTTSPPSPPPPPVTPSINPPSSSTPNQGWRCGVCHVRGGRAGRKDANHDHTPG